MSRATKRKYVSKEVLEDFVELNADQEIVKVLGGRGNNLHEVEDGDGNRFLVSMPTKFRRNIWIKRGDHIVVEPITEGDKVKAEIVHILYPRQIKELKEEKKWPARFQDKSKPSPATLNVHELDRFRQRSGNETAGSDREEQTSTDSDDEDSDLFVNTNRPPPFNNGGNRTSNNYSSSSSSTADEDDNPDQ